jgi:hypothetical protein
MDALTDSTKEIFYLLLSKRIPLSEFEQWVYSNSTSLEDELQLNLYYDLVSHDYNQKDSLHFIQEKIKPQIDGEDYKIWKTRRLLTDIVENQLDLVVATRQLRELYFETGENFIPIKLGVGYDSVLDDVPTPDEYGQWSEQGLQEKLKKVESYRDDIIRDAKSFLNELKNK